LAVAKSDVDGLKKTKLGEADFSLKGWGELTPRRLRKGKRIADQGLNN
jgi:hypothetical protein